MGVEGRPQKVARLAVTLADLPQVNDGVSARDSDEQWLRRWGGERWGGGHICGCSAEYRQTVCANARTEKKINSGGGRESVGFTQNYDHGKIC